MEKEICIIIPTLNEDKEILESVVNINSIIKRKTLVVSYFSLKKGTLKKLEELGCITIKNKKSGRGYMIVNAYKRMKGRFHLFSYVDSDLPFKKTQLKRFWEESVKGKYDILAASKQTGKIKSSITRKITSKTYHLLSNLILFGRFDVADFQTGLKSWRRGIIEDVLKNKDIDEEWFFDTQLIYYAIKKGKRVEFFSIDAVIHKNSSIRVFYDSAKFIINLIKLKTTELFG